jgi:hypothetical protein
VRTTKHIPPNCERQGLFEKFAKKSTDYTDYADSFTTKACPDLSGTLRHQDNILDLPTKSLCLCGEFRTGWPRMKGQL